VRAFSLQSWRLRSLGAGERIGGVTFEFFLKAPKKLGEAFDQAVGSVEVDGDRAILEVPCEDGEGNRPYRIVGEKQAWTVPMGVTRA
jgi:hypothetical protein